MSVPKIFRLPRPIRAVLIRTLATWPRFFRRERKYDLVILKLDHIGDFILSTGAIRFALERSEGKALLIVSHPVEAIARTLFPRADVLALPAFAPALVRHLLPVAWKSAANLRSIRSHELLHLRYQPDDYHRLIQKWIGPEAAYGMESTSYLRWREGLTLPLKSAQKIAYPDPDRRYLDPAENRIACAEIEAHRRLCETWGGCSVSLEDVWPEIGPAIEGSAKFNSSGELLVAPFASTRIREIRPAPLIASLLAFQNEAGLPVGVACGPGERERGRKLVEVASRSGLKNVRLLPEQSLADYLRTVASARLVLSMDSATAHVAVAAGVPGVALLGGGHFGCFAPWSKADGFTWLNHPVPCNHCEWHCHRPENECLSSIPPEAIADALLARWQSGEPARSHTRPDVARSSQ